MAARRQRARESTCFRRPRCRGGKIYRVTRANFNSERTTPQTLPELLRAGHRGGSGARLTVNPGIRYEQEAMSGSIIKDFCAEEQLGPRALARDLRSRG